MHCWKTINVKKQYGFDRIFMLSSILVIAVFSLFYVMIGILNDSRLSDERFSIFILSFVLIYPIHKALHCIPLVRYSNNIQFSVKKQFNFIPILSIRIKEPVPKALFLFALLAPFFIINSILVAGAFMLPAFGHYFTILLAFHSGLCLIDLLYIKNLARSPKKAFIEETDTGYEILVPPATI
ncbi:DUF3267 domain-containing protein [Paenisporosarcina antarctica]|uniref:DUF3267 domain-containing protein n=1 Tax=Paenisporosarcina antarctica TaxID=417367 RepID=A0A4P6ZVT0_9BACL|nr:DUF3267 domain-containing protein [Paenisporosarcina antarctica]QBP40427.1 DUF3267 domain-containing protein [Paenisporosarcina antarctica]